MPSLDNFNYDIWTLACDIVTEKIILELEPTYDDKKIRVAKNGIFDDITEHYKTFNAITVYKYINEFEDDIDYLKSLFYRDDHHIWYIKREKDNNSDKSYNKPDEPEKNNPNESQEKNDSAENGNSNNNSNENKNNNDSKNQNLENTSQIDNKDASQWKEISKTAKVMMESFGNTAGNSTLKENIDFAHAKRYKYKDFLKKFVSLREELKVNPDEFDYIYYQFGLNLYGNIPLIEPLEYKDENQIRNIAIAIDTSGSTQGELVKNFLTATYDIIKNSGYFKNKFNLYIIQCDAKIQDVKIVKSQKEFDDYINNLEIKGKGGTSFIPVFEYLNNFVKNIKGLIYFTDGYGKYPDKRPPYKTAFVFMREEYIAKDFPKWAVKTVFTN